MTWSRASFLQVLTPVQAAIFFVNTCPWYPDVLALANLVAAQRGEQGPDELFGEASSIRLAPSVTAALRRQAEHINSNARAPDVSAPTFQPPPPVMPTNLPRLSKPVEAPGSIDSQPWHMSRLVPRFTHPGPPGPPGQAHSSLFAEHLAPPSLRHGPGSDVSNGSRRQRNLPGEPGNASTARASSDCATPACGGVIKQSDSAPSRVEGPGYRGDSSSGLDMSALLGPPPLPSFSKANGDGAANAAWLLHVTSTPPQHYKARSATSHDAVAGGHISEDVRRQATAQPFSQYSSAAPSQSASQAFTQYAPPAPQQSASQSFSQYASPAALQSALQPFGQYAEQSASGNGFFAMLPLPSSSNHSAAGSGPHSRPMPDPPPPQADSRSKTSAPELLSSTLSQLLETATQQYQNRMSEAADAPTTSPPHQGVDFPMTWSSSIFGSALPSTMSFGVPAGAVPYPGDGQLGSPITSMMVPDVATILSGLESEARQHELSVHYGFEQKKSGPLPAYS